MRRRALLFGGGALLFGVQAHAQPAVIVERAVVRFWTPDTGGVKSPHFVYARVLAFEARVEALADAYRGSSALPYRDRHVTDALERHIAESVLAGLRIDPEPSSEELARHMQSARARLEQRAGGAEALDAAAAAEGLALRDLLEIARRQARASLYLDRMVAPMLAPSREELALLHRTRNTPFRELPFDQIEPGLRRWFVSQRLAGAVQSFYQNARGRIVFTQLGELPAGAAPSW